MAEKQTILSKKTLERHTEDSYRKIGTQMEGSGNSEQEVIKILADLRDEIIRSLNDVSGSLITRVDQLDIFCGLVDRRIGKFGENLAQNPNVPEEVRNDVLAKVREEHQKAKDLIRDHYDFEDPDKSRLYAGKESFEETDYLECADEAFLQFEIFVNNLFYAYADSKEANVCKTCKKLHTRTPQDARLFQKISRVLSDFETKVAARLAELKYKKQRCGFPEFRSIMLDELRRVKSRLRSFYLIKNLFHSAVSDFFADLITRTQSMNEQEFLAFNVEKDFQHINGDFRAFLRKYAKQKLHDGGFTESEDKKANGKGIKPEENDEYRDPAAAAMPRKTVMDINQGNPNIVLAQFGPQPGVQTVNVPSADEETVMRTNEETPVYFPEVDEKPPVEAEETAPVAPEKPQTSLTEPDTRRPVILDGAVEILDITPPFIAATLPQEDDRSSEQIEDIETVILELLTWSEKIPDVKKTVYARYEIEALAQILKDRTEHSPKLVKYAVMKLSAIRKNTTVDETTGLMGFKMDSDAIAKTYADIFGRLQFQNAPKNPLSQKLHEMIKVLDVQIEALQKNIEEKTLKREETVSRDRKVREQKLKEQRDMLQELSDLDAELKDLTSVMTKLLASEDFEQMTEKNVIASKKKQRKKDLQSCLETLQQELDTLQHVDGLEKETETEVAQMREKITALQEKKARFIQSIRGLVERYPVNP